MISRIDLEQLKAQTGLNHIVQIGTQYGDGVEYILRSGFTYEACDASMFIFSVTRARYPSLKVYNMPYDEFIESVKKPCVYYLPVNDIEERLKQIVKKKSFRDSVVIVYGTYMDIEIIDNLSSHLSQKYKNGGGFLIAAPKELIDQSGKPSKVWFDDLFFSGK